MSDLDLVAFGIFVLGLGFGMYLGWRLRDIEDAIASIAEDVPEPPRVGVTKGAYKKVDEAEITKARPVGKRSGVVKAKSPQLMEWEAQEQTRKDSEHWGIKPRH